MQNYLRIAILFFVTLTSIAAGNPALAQASPDSSTGFPPLDQWKAAVIAGDSSALQSLYSAAPPAQVSANGTTGAADADTNFWLGLKAHSLQTKIVRLKQRPSGESVIFHAEVVADGNPLSVVEAQGWRNTDGQWKLVSVERTDAPHLKQPSDMNKDIYPAEADARAEIQAAEQRAAAARKRVILVFGANWCYDCHVLDLAFHQPELAPALAAGYEVVHIDLGLDGKKNADIAAQFNVPLDKGIPVLAVIESDGKVVVSQKNGEFEDARSLTPEALHEFLNRWKPQAQ